MNTLDPSTLDSTALARRLADLAADERRVQVDFLLHLDEFDRRRAYLEEGYGSLWAYCLGPLHLREGAAGRRIGATRVLRRFPALEPALRDGRLCLSTVSLLGQVLTSENLADLVDRAAYRTKAEVEQIVVAIKPRPAPADGVRRVAARPELVLPSSTPDPAAALSLAPPAPAEPAPRAIQRAGAGRDPGRGTSAAPGGPAGGRGPLVAPRDARCHGEVRARDAEGVAQPQDPGR